MPKDWSAKDERQYKHVLKSCLRRDRRKTKKCKSIAAATVNKRRAEEGRAEDLYGLGIFGLEDNRRASNIGMGIGVGTAAIGVGLERLSDGDTRKVGEFMIPGGLLLTATSAAYHPDNAVKIFVGVPASVLGFMAVFGAARMI